VHAKYNGNSGGCGGGGGTKSPVVLCYENVTLYALYMFHMFRKM
jgi:hypothetical protein